MYKEKVQRTCRRKDSPAVGGTLAARMPIEPLSVVDLFWKNKEYQYSVRVSVIKW